MAQLKNAVFSRDRLIREYDAGPHSDILFPDAGNEVFVIRTPDANFFFTRWGNNGCLYWFGSPQFHMAAPCDTKSELRNVLENDLPKHPALKQSIRDVIGILGGQPAFPPAP